jgi:hypothetical protein
MKYPSKNKIVFYYEGNIVNRETYKNTICFRDKNLGYVKNVVWEMTKNGGYHRSNLSNI